MLWFILIQYTNVGCHIAAFAGKTSEHVWCTQYLKTLIMVWWRHWWPIHFLFSSTGLVIEAKTVLSNLNCHLQYVVSSLRRPFLWPLFSDQRLVQVVCILQWCTAVHCMYSYIAIVIMNPVHVRRFTIRHISPAASSRECSIAFCSRPWTTWPYQ